MNKLSGAIGIASIIVAAVSVVFVVKSVKKDIEQLDAQIADVNRTNAELENLHSTLRDLNRQAEASIADTKTIIGDLKYLMETRTNQ